MPKINFTQFLSFIILFSFSTQTCSENSNHCLRCDPLTNLCAECDKNIYKPDSEGGCEPSKECIFGQNFCNSCESNNLCSSCENGFFADENGGCSTTDNCIISYKGECLQCNDDFYLVGTNKYKFCKYKYTEDLSNCQTINYETGLCQNCNDGYFLTGESKCTNTEFCRESLYSVCTECYFGFYLDKRNDTCISNWDIYGNCKVTLDGKTCDECNKNFYLSKDGKCVYTNYCLKADKYYVCQKCEDNYFLTGSYNICTNEKNCQLGHKDFGICVSCKNNFYYDEDTKKCFSNQENDDFKYCLTANSNKCIKCIENYELSTDSKCSKSKNCIKVENGICTQCEENYHLGLDNLCSNIEKCIRTDSDKCVECEENYYYDANQTQCVLETDQFIGCRESIFDGESCKNCRKGYYLNYITKTCYDNSEEGPLYKCEKSNENVTLCDLCEEDYYLDSEDLKCTKINGCAVSENENKCVKCNVDYCLDINKGICVGNLIGPENENGKIYYLCNETNNDGTECAICKKESLVIENGACVNKADCAEEIDGECVKCNEKNSDGTKMCLNSVFGCVETEAKNCLKCDNILNFNECTECVEGSEFSDNGECVEM